MRAQSRASTGPSGSWRSTTRTRGGYLPNGVAKLLRVEPSHLHPEGSWPSALASRPQTDLKVMATGLSIGILLDATILRSLLVPSLVSLFGWWNWQDQRGTGHEPAGAPDAFDDGGVRRSRAVELLPDPGQINTS